MRNKSLLRIVLLCCLGLFWNAENDVQAQTKSIFVKAFDITTDGKLIAKGLSDRSIELWDNQTQKLIQTYAGPYPEAGANADLLLNDLQFSPDNTELAVSFGDTVGVQDGFVWVFSIPDGKLIAELDARGYGGSLAWQPDSQRLAVATAYGTGSPEEYGFRIWNTSDWSVLQDIQLPIKLLAVLSWSPDGQLLAVANGNLIKLYDTQTWKVLQKLKGHADYIMSVDWNGDSTKLASSSLDQTLRIWDISSNTEIYQFKRQTPATFSNIVLWSVDGQSVISLGDYDIEVWNTNSKSLQESRSLAPDWIEDAEKTADKIVYLGAKGDLNTLDGQSY